ncbi:MAG TPA: hypothetical protein VEG38_08685 [Acidimicrobiia bacterium]|nr:hypothetical protein [Acidimicrobiia bacterium]
MTLAMLAVGAGCGGGTDERAADQPVTTGTEFGYGNFDELPRYSRSEPLGTRTEKAGAVSQSFKAEGATPTQILDFYARRLKDAGWNVVEPVHELGVGTVRGRWADPKWILTVSATAAPTLSAPQGAIQDYSQYSLSLRPAEVPATAGPAGESATPAVVDTAGFVDRNFTVTPVRDYDPIPDQTAFSWQITGDGPADYILVVPCRDVPSVFAVGPTGPPAQSQPVADAATGLTGFKWQPGTLGTYTVEYEGPIAAAELILKNGAGSRRVRAGTMPCANP